MEQRPSMNVTEISLCICKSQKHLVGRSTFLALDEGDLRRSHMWWGECCTTAQKIQNTLYAENGKVLPSKMKCRLKGRSQTQAA